MKLSVYENQAESNEVFLKLKQTGDGVSVIAVNKNGEYHSAGNLITFNSDGRVTLHHGVSSSLGFQLNSRKQLEIN